MAKPRKKTIKIKKAATCSFKDKKCKCVLFAVATAAILVIAVLLAGAFAFGWFKTPVKDCGTDHNCFLDAYVACTPAKLLVQDYSLSLVFEIKGAAKDKCDISIKLAEPNAYADCSIPINWFINPTAPDPLSKYCWGPLVDAKVLSAWKY